MLAVLPMAAALVVAPLATAAVADAPAAGPAGPVLIGPPVRKVGPTPTVSSVTATGAVLSWVVPAIYPPIDASYDLYLVVGDGRLVHVASSKVSRFVITGLLPATKYSFAVTSTDWNGNESLPGPVVSFTTLSTWSTGAGSRWDDPVG